MPPIAIDFDSLLEKLDGDRELVEEIVGMFLEDYPVRIAALRDAMSAGDASALGDAAHTLKGAISNFGAEAAQEAAFDLERRGREARLDGIDSACKLFEAEADRVIAELREFLTR